MDNIRIHAVSVSEFLNHIFITIITQYQFIDIKMIFKALQDMIICHQETQ